MSGQDHGAELYGYAALVREHGRVKGTQEYLRRANVRTVANISQDQAEIDAQNIETLRKNQDYLRKLADRYLAKLYDRKKPSASRDEEERRIWNALVFKHGGETTAMKCEYLEDLYRRTEPNVSDEWKVVEPGIIRLGETAHFVRYIKHDGFQIFRGYLHKGSVKVALDLMICATLPDAKQQAERMVFDLREMGMPT